MPHPPFAERDTPVRHVLPTLCALAALGFTGVARGDGRLTVLPRLGLVLSSPGTLVVSGSCSAAGCPPEVTEGAMDAEDPKMRVAVGADVLVRLDPLLRVGGGLHVVRGLELRPEGPDANPDAALNVGSTVDVHGLAEARVRLSRRLTLPLRAELGLLLLKKSDALKDRETRSEAACRDLAELPNASCESRGTLGLHLGAGAGLAYSLGPVGLRLDFLYAFDWLRVSQRSITLGDASFDSGTALKLRRAMLLLGVEI